MAMQSKKKIMIAAIAGSMAAALIIGGGSFAFLKSNSETITNNFKTNKVEVDIDETDGENKQYQYNIIPGTEESKNPVAYITTTVPAYLFVTITDETDDLVTYEVITGENGWTKLDGKDNVYYRTVEAKEGQQNFDILKNNKVSYDSGIENKDMAGKDDIKLSFDVFGIQQAGFADAAAAYAQAPTKVSNQEELNAALANAKDGDTIQLAPNETPYKLPADIPNINLFGSDPKTTFVNATALNHSTNNRSFDLDAENVTFKYDDEYYAEDNTNTKARTLAMNGSGTFKNCVFDGSTRDAIRDVRLTGDLVFEDCTINGRVYGLNVGGGATTGNVVVKNCDIYGWNSFGASGTGTVTFEGCRFHKSSSQGYLRFYQDAKVTNCTFDEEFEAVDILKDGVTIEMTGCTGLPTTKLHNTYNKNNPEVKYTAKWIINGEVFNVPEDQRTEASGS